MTSGERGEHQPAAYCQSSDLLLSRGDGPIHPHMTTRVRILRAKWMAIQASAGAS